MARKLGEKQIEEFRENFIKQQQTIYKEYDLKKNDTCENLDFDGDETDIIQGNMLLSILENLSERDKLKLCNIQKALKRIDDGSFGNCIECEKPIGKARLLARPEAELCIACAEDAEKELKELGKKL